MDFIEVFENNVHSTNQWARGLNNNFLIMTFIKFNRLSENFALRHLSH